MRALVLGGNGFIGSHLVDRLLLDGFSVSVLDLERERFRKPLKKVSFIQGEFTSKDLIEKSVKDMDLVFHLISTTLPQSSNDDPAFDITSNLLGSIQLCKVCASLGVRKVVFLSSGGTIYGKPNQVKISESHSTNPECSYGIVKLAIEKYLALFNKLYGLKYVVLRASNPYGPRQHPAGRQGVVAVFLGKILQNREIEVWGNGQVVRDYIAVEDLAEGLFQAGIRETPSRIYNIGSGSGTSINELIRLLALATECTPSIVYRPGRLCDVPSVILNCSLAARELEWTPMISIEQGLKRTWKFIQDSAYIAGLET